MRNNSEICKCIAEIEGVDVDSNCGYTLRETPFTSCQYLSYNPLTDDALCFKLMVKYRVWRWSNPRDGKFNVCIKGVQGWFSGDTLNKAICLAIIEVMEDK